MRLEMISSNADMVELGIEESKCDNEYVAFLKTANKKKYVHSKYNPKASAQKLINLEGVNEETIWFVFGLGLGYTAKQILKIAGAKNKIIIVEPTSTLFETQKAYIKDLLEDNRIHIFYGDSRESLNKLLIENIKVKDLKNIKLIIEPTYEEYFKAYYVGITNVINAHLNNIKVSFDTYNKFIENNLMNILANKEALLKSYDIRKYKDKYKNVPALIVSAGPSLEKNIEYIKDFKGIIFTGTRTVHHIKEQSVTPDFLVCVDPGEIAYDILRDHKENDINLIATENACAKVVQYNKGKQYFITGNERGTSKKLLDLELPHIPAFGSVANLCLSVAQSMGCSPIIFIGQDLAYTNSKAHVDNYRSHDMASREMTYVKGITEEKVPTSTALLLFLRWIEDFIRETQDDTKYYNCTEGGAWIEGAQHEAFKDVVAKYNEACDKAYDFTPLFEDKVAGQVEEQFKRFTLECSQLITFFKDEIKTLESAYAAFIKEGKSINQIIVRSTKDLSHHIKKMNKIFEELYLVECAKEEMQLHNKPRFDETTEEIICRSVTKTINIYTNMHDRLERIQEFIEKDLGQS